MTQPTTPSAQSLGTAGEGAAPSGSQTTAPPDEIFEAGPKPTLLHAAAALALVAVGDLFFYGPEDVGWTAGVFAGLLMLAMVFLNPRLIKRPAGLILFFLVAGLPASFAESPTLLATALFVAGLAALALADRAHLTAKFWFWAEAALLLLLQGFLRLPIDAAASVGSVHRLRLPTRTSEIIAIWALPLGLSAVFMLLFASGNPVIAKWLEPLEWFQNLELDLPDEARVVFWMALLLVSWIFLRASPFFVPSERVLGSQSPAADGTATDAATTEFKLFPTPSPAMVVRAMVLFNIVFAIQNGLDLEYLWGGAELPEGVTFASYVHSGTYPLIASALLAGAVVLLAFPSNATQKPSRWAYALMYVWIIQNVFLILSAMQRMALYVDAYALTYLRIAAVVWMGLVATGLILIVLRIIFNKSGRWLINTNILALIAVFYVSCFVDFARHIADYNVANCRELGGRGVPLDVKYLRKIGTSSIPALNKFLSVAPEKTEKRRFARYSVSVLEKSLLKSQSDWRTWTFRGDRLMREIAADAPQSQ